MSPLKLRVDSSVVVGTVWLLELVKVASTSTEEEVTVLPLAISEVLRASVPMVLSDASVVRAAVVSGPVVVVDSSMLLSVEDS
jgi:hypothetical protein